MECDIYKSLKYKGCYLFVEKGSIITNDVPKELLSKFGSAEHFKTISVDENAPLIAADPQEIIKNIQEKGHHLQWAKTNVDTVSEAGAALGGGILAVSLGLGPVGAIIAAAAGYALANSTKNERQSSGENKNADS